MKKKILQFITVVIIMALSYGVYFFVSTRGAEKPPETVGAESLSQGINPVGNFSNGWVSEVSSADEFHALASYDYVVVTATEVIPTGVYTRKAWIGPYDAGRTSTSLGNRRKNPIPEESTNPLTDIEYMHQYFLIKLSDGSYINAILENQYVDEIKDTGSFTLPIGIQQGITANTKEMLADISEEYDVSSTPVYYAVADTWYSENQGGINITAMLWGIAIFVALVVIAAFTLGKVFEIKEYYAFF